MTIPRMSAALALLLAWSIPAVAQDGEAPRRTRITLGPQLVPSYPGADSVRISPFIDVSRGEGETPMAFEAPDESTGFVAYRNGPLAIGPAIGFEGSRRARDVGAALPKVGFTVELGGFVQYELTDAVRVRAEVRQGVGGHKGLIGNVGADYIARSADEWLFSVGPRVTLAGNRYQDAYFSVTPAVAASSGVPAFDAGAGVQAVGVTAGFLKQITPRWGVYTYGKIDRLVGDAADSPVVRGYGSRNQLSGGLALTYTFGRGR